MSNTYVPAVGPRDAKIVVVGEAPGKNEVRTKQPFTGYSGNIFRSTVSGVGIPPSNIFITNVCHYRPPGNQIKRWITTRKVGGEQRLYPNARVAEGIVELFADLAEIKPNVIVPMGNVALWTLTGQQQITKRRGSIMAVDWDLERAKAISKAVGLDDDFLDNVAAVMGTKVIPTIHPAAVMRMYEYMAPFQTDWTRIREDSRFPELRLPDREIILNPTGKELEQLHERLLGADLISYDIEVVGGTRLYCVGFTDDPSWAMTLTANTSENMAVIRNLLTCPVPKLAQNGLFDASFLALYSNIDVTNFHHDTMVAQAVAYPELPKGLDFMCSVYTREPYYKDEGKSWSPRDAEDVERFLTYNAKDVAATLEVFEAQRSSELQDEHHRDTYERIMSQLPAYLDMMVNGIRVDLREQKRLAEKYTKDYQALQAGLDEQAIKHLADIHEHLIARGSKDRAAQVAAFIKNILPGVGTAKGGLNVNSSKVICEYLYEIRGMKTKRNRKTGRPTAGEDALKELYSETQDPFLLTIVKIRQLRKRLSSYINVKTDSVGTTYFSVNPVRAETGRSSMGQTITGMGHNMQTNPHELRTMYIPDSGCVFMYYDLDQAEARVVAYRAGIRRMIEAFEKPFKKYTDADVHSVTAHNLLEIPYDQIEEYPHRYLGKRCNHALNYEMGPEKFYKVINKDAVDTGVSLTRKEAKQLRKKHLRTYPELQWYWEDIKEQIRANRTIINPFGRKRVFLGRMGDDTFREAYSHYAQSTVADVLRTGMSRAFREIVQDYRAHGEHRVRIVLEIHDALLWQIPRDMVSEVAPRVVEAMTVPFTINDKEITIPVGAEIGDNWGDMEKWDGP